MSSLFSRLFKARRGEGPKLILFATLALLLQAGIGIGFSAADAAFLSKVGADQLPVIFLLTPAVMLVYTLLFSYLLLRFSIDRVVDLTIMLLAAGGILFWRLLETELPAPFDTAIYYALKLYLAMWYIALYSLFWNFADAYFDIADAKRLFPLFAAGAALGMALGALIVGTFAAIVPLSGFFLIWSGLALATYPVVLAIRRRWKRITEADVGATVEDRGLRAQVGQILHAFWQSRYTALFALALFTALLATNLAEFQYATVLQEGRDEAELAALFGRLYAAANVFNMLVCLFLFYPMVNRLGVRNAALILPITYFLTFSYFFVDGGAVAALVAFWAYHGVLTSIEYNNQNLLFNALPSELKRPLRTVIEGLCEPLASCLAGAFLLLLAPHLNMRELSGIGILLGAALIGFALLLRTEYPQAMARNIARGWLDFGSGDRAGLPPDPDSDVEAIPELLEEVARLGPRERRRLVARLKGLGDVAVPGLAASLRRRDGSQASRAVAARALAAVSYPQFAAMALDLVQDELQESQGLLDTIGPVEQAGGRSVAAKLLALYYRERVAASIDYALDLLALARKLPNYDLLVVSLHSSNPKVRANAMEAIETGVDHKTFRLIERLLLPSPVDGMALGGEGDPIPLLTRALASSHPFEAAAAAQALADLAPSDRLPFLLRGALQSNLAPAVRETIALLLGLPVSARATLVDRVAELRAISAYRYATIDTLVALAEAPEEADSVSCRFVDLALSRLKTQDERHAAA